MMREPAEIQLSAVTAVDTAPMNEPGVCAGKSNLLWIIITNKWLFGHAGAGTASITIHPPLIGSSDDFVALRPHPMISRR